MWSLLLPFPCLFAYHVFRHKIDKCQRSKIPILTNCLWGDLPQQPTSAFRRLRKAPDGQDLMVAHERVLAYGLIFTTSHDGTLSFGSVTSLHINQEISCVVFVIHQQLLQVWYIWLRAPFPDMKNNYATRSLVLVSSRSQ